MKQYIFGLFIFLILFSSCDEKEYLEEGIGYLYVNASKNIDVVTKADADVEPISIAICKAATGDTAKFFENYTTDLGNNKVQLPAGKYYVKAGTIHSGKAAFDKPFYYGVDTIEVVKATIKESEVVCTLANVKVTVNYSDLLKKFFTGYKATISNASGELTFEEDEKRAGYFTPGKLNVVLSLVNNDGTAYQIVKEIPDVKAREHYRLFFSIGEEPENPEAGGNFDITVNEETNDIECTLKVPVFTDDYGRNKPKIEIESSKISEDKIMNIIEGNEAGETLTATLSSEKTGVELFALRLNSEFFQTTCGLPEYIELSKMDDAMKVNFEKTGITYSPISTEGTTSVTLNFSGLLNKEMLSVTDPKPILNEVTFIVRDKLGQQVEEHVTIRIRPNIAVQTLEPTPWPYRVYLKGLAGDNTDLSFKYRKKGEDDSQWQSVSVDPSDVKQTDDGYEYCGVLKGLTMNTAYEYKAIAGETEGAVKEFLTEGTPVIPNLSFDKWTTNNKIIYPNESLSGLTYCWDSGNKGANSAKKTPTEEETVDVVEGSAAKLHTEMAKVLGIGKLAAGNLYTGKFGEVSMNPVGATLNWGYPYTGHPTKLTGYYKYTSGKITDTEKSFIKVGDQDSCHIYIALCNWKSTFTVNTSTGDFVDFSENNSDIIAYGEFKAVNTINPLPDKNNYGKFVADIKYRHPEVKPTYIMVVVTSSKYGDYFTGSTSSVLLVDEFEFLFDDPTD